MTAAPASLRLALAVCVALVAFAANSVLCRLALASGAIGPGAFTAVRLVSGALALAVLAAATGRIGQTRGALGPVTALALFGYAAAFSFAYVRLDAGTGALVLFGAVQASMFAGALWLGERPAPARWLGAAAALGGLGWLAAPGAAAPDPLGAGLMALSGVAWGVFSLKGRSAGPPTAAVTAAFLLSAPLGLALWGLAGPGETVTAQGVALAVASGALASGAGYAVWYGALPRLDASLAGVAQLTVPLIALAGGVLLLGEPVPARFPVAAALILGGVGAATLIGRGRR
jgi:drug/metabolite transporter (DMT)-like permease